MSFAMTLKRLVRLDFVPASTDAGLLLLRAWLGLSMFLIHGLGKVSNFTGTIEFFRDKQDIPPILGVAAVMTETLASVLLAIGLATRWAALAGVVAMSVAFFKVHDMVLTQGDAKSGELAFIYLGGYLAILIAGAGRWSVDAKLAK
jgi:putative oxidoreductase